MYTLIRLPDGNIVEAVVLARTRSRMRLAAAGYTDVVELRLCGLDWLDEGNEPVQFGFLLATDDRSVEAPRMPQPTVRYAC